MKFYRQTEMYAKFLNVLNVIFIVFFNMGFAFTPVVRLSPKSSQIKSQN